MHNETIAKLGFEAGAESVGFFTLKKFAELVAAHEREQCARLVDLESKLMGKKLQSAEAIRARSA
jgi:hypothetical protein